MSLDSIRTSMECLKVELEGIEENEPISSRRAQDLKNRVDALGRQLHQLELSGEHSLDDGFFRAAQMWSYLETRITDLRLAAFRSVSGSSTLSLGDLRMAEVFEGESSGDIQSQILSDQEQTIVDDLLRDPVMTRPAYEQQLNQAVESACRFEPGSEMRNVLFQTMSEQFLNHCRAVENAEKADAYREVLEEAGYTFVPIAPDGNCLFAAFAKGVENSWGWQEGRKKVKAFIEQNRQVLQDREELLPADLDERENIDQAAKSREDWGSLHLDTRLLAWAFERPVRVHCHREGHLFNFTQDKDMEGQVLPGEIIHILYNGNDHFDLLRAPSV